jgi:hypothetical protein
MGEVRQCTDSVDNYNLFDAKRNNIYHLRTDFLVLEEYQLLEYDAV